MTFALRIAEIYRMIQSLADYRMLLNKYYEEDSSWDYLNQKVLDKLLESGSTKAWDDYFNNPKYFGYYSVQEGVNEVALDDVVSEPYMVLYETEVEKGKYLAIICARSSKLLSAGKCRLHLAHYDSDEGKYICNCPIENHIGYERYCTEILSNILFTSFMWRKKWYSSSEQYQKAYKLFNQEFVESL